MRKKSCYIKSDWLDIFPEPIKFRVTSPIRIRRHYEKGLFVWPFQNKSTFHTNIILNYTSFSYKDRLAILKGVVCSLKILPKTKIPETKEQW